VFFAARRVNSAGKRAKCSVARSCSRPCMPTWACEVTLRKQILVWQGTWGGDTGHGARAGMGLGTWYGITWSVLKPRLPEMQPPARPPEAKAAALFVKCAFCPLYSDFALSCSQVPQVPQLAQVPPAAQVPDATLPPLAHSSQRLARPHPDPEPIVDCRQLAEASAVPNTAQWTGLAADVGWQLPCRIVENGMTFQPPRRDRQLSVPAS
jgi:hypothetical protein